MLRRKVPTSPKASGLLTTLIKRPLTVTTMKRTFRQLMLGGCLLLASVGGFAVPRASAQDPPPKSGVVTTTTSTSNYVLEYGIVIVMFGAALFAVCRTSRRNM